MAPSGATRGPSKEVNDRADAVLMGRWTFDIGRPNWGDVPFRVPVLLGRGVRLFEYPGADEHPGPGPHVTHLRYRRRPA